MARKSQRSTPRSTPWHARQGDVLIVRADRIPSEAKPKPRDGGRVILAYGEVTGHAHAIDDSPASPRAALLDAPSGETYLRVDALSQLVHEEHATIELEPGSYRVIRQREYSPEAIRNVAD